MTGTSAANAAAEAADVVIGIGCRLQDFTTGSRALFANPDHRLVQVNVGAFDAHKQGALPVVGDARAVIQQISERLAGYRVSAGWESQRRKGVLDWNAAYEAATAPPRGPGLPSDAQVIGAVQRAADEDAIVVCAAGGLPGELHKLWRTAKPGGYHLEYGYSCMGYEIAGGLGAKMAAPASEVFVMVGDGSYLMLNSEIATSVMLGRKLIVTVLDNRGYGCIDRLQRAAGGEGFNNLLADAAHEVLPHIDFAAHAASLGARSEKVGSIAELEDALARAKASDRTYVVVIDTDPSKTTAAGGAWWDVAIPEVSERPAAQSARRDYEASRKNQDLGG